MALLLLLASSLPDHGTRAVGAQESEVTYWNYAVTGPTGYTRGAYDPRQDAAIVVSVLNGENSVW